MINVWQLLIHFAVIYNYSHSAKFSGSFFSIHHIDGVRLSYRYRAEESASLLSCCILCHGDSSCRSVSYQLSTGLCELNDESTYEGSDSVKEDGWTTYNRSKPRYALWNAENSLTVTFGFIVEYAHEKSDCPGGWKYHNGSCYYFGRIAVSWHTALMECRKKGGYLAEINGKTENTFIKEQATLIGESVIWIGGSDEDQEGTWTWVSSGTRISPETFQDWGNKEPNGHSSENCLCLHKYHQYQWTDVDCESKVMYVCEL